MLPHIEQKHNNNQLPLQHIGNITYHQGKTATSYDSVNSLTTHNNQYTLLYPDLVQELFNFALHNSNRTNNSPFLRSLGVNNTKSSSLDSSISCSLDSLLSPRDILFFLQIVSLYQLELSKGHASITYPSLKLARLLGVDTSCDDVNVLGDANMRATILKMTSKLEALGMLKVFRSKRKNGMDLANKLIPVLPDRLHARIKDSPSNLKVSDSSKLEHESNLEHILRTKLFVPIELEFMKNLFKDKMSSKYKLFFLNCIMSAYRNFRQNSCNYNMISFSATSSELMNKNNISKRTLFNIFRYIKQQGDSFFLKVEHKYTKSDDIDCNRYDKSIFVISINPLVFPISQIKQSQTEEIINCDCDELQDEVSPIFPDIYGGFKTGVQKKQPSSAKKTALNNKEKIIKNKYNKNIDYIDENCETVENSSVPCLSSTPTSVPVHLPTTKNTVVNHKEEFFEDKQSLSSSKSYNNSSFLNDSCKSKNMSGYKELRHFYPLSDKDINLLNSRANREFSNNFVNQLLLKLYIKYPEKRFKNRFTFLSYMVQILVNEKHQGPLVNHTSFRFSCNVGTEEKRTLEYEKYLNQIEDSLDTSKEMQLKKKIAGRFSTEIAYKILTKVEFKTNHDNSFITALIPKNQNQVKPNPTKSDSTNQNWLNNDFELSKRQIVTLSQQLEAVYGINGYYVQEVEQKVIKLPKSSTTDIEFNDKSMEILGTSNRSVSNTEEIPANTAWHQIRKGLREEFGEHIDKVWFSKAVATTCTETNTLILTMPTRFMSDWVKNNYSHVIQRLAGSVGMDFVEYGYE